MRKVVTLVIPFLLAAYVGKGQCLSGDCHTGKGILLYPNGERYVGQFWEGKKHGEGTYYYRNGSRYQGQWAKNLPHGDGQKLFRDGTRLEGYWETGKLIRRVEHISDPGSYVARGGGQTGCISGDCANGRGIYIYPSGAIYIGEFLAGEIHGVGVCYYSDGSKYQGEWVHRYPEGRGTKIYPDGNKRTGRWKKGQPVDDFGNLVPEIVNVNEADDDGTEIQTGCVKGNCASGQGTFAYADGSRYEGQFYDGKPEGWGTFYYLDGDKYIGSFQAGVPHGRGRRETADGQIRLSGEWRNGEFKGLTAALRSAGCLAGNCESGFGTFAFPDGSKYVGPFYRSRPHGRGTIFYSNGQRYEGEMVNGNLEGEGTLFLKDGTRVSGQWKNNSYAGVLTEPYSQPSETRPAQNLEPVKALAAAAPDTKVWAVIIGVASYNHMPVLRYTDDDAYRIFAFLKSPEGGALPDSQIRILIDEDATKQKIIEAISQTFGRAGANDLVFLYFSGHGLKGSFLPFDFDGYNNKLFHEEINDLLQRSPAKYKFCIADACHSGSLLAMRSGAELPTIVSYYENLAKAQAGTALIMSSKSDETSLESSGLRQGVFSHFLIRGLKGEADTDYNNIVTIQELFDFVQRNVRSYTGNRQSPVIQGDYDKSMTVAVKR